MAEKLLNDDAQGIVEVGVLAAKAGKDVAQAVEGAIGKLYGRYRGTGASEAGPFDALREIAILYVQGQVHKQSA